ncbi:hypothetical protein NFI96_008821 [Prochilodus magdalenae]|nr:hypothetical protein NFI96_008821 [Prochilodus magdalenae]
MYKCMNLCNDCVCMCRVFVCVSVSCVYLLPSLKLWVCGCCGCRVFVCVSVFLNIKHSAEVTCWYGGTLSQGTFEREGTKMERFQIPPPPKFDFTWPEEWPKWIKRFERFRIASGLELQAEENQVNTLIYTMGDEAEDHFTSADRNRSKPV